MLHNFLDEYKKEIIKLCREKVLSNTFLKPTSALLDQGLPIFYDELIGVLQRTADFSTKRNVAMIENRIKIGDAADHGKESLRLGYSISQVVHSYGAVCQSITEFVQTKSFKITSQEFRDLNLSLDYAIAEAVTEFQEVKIENVNNSNAQQLGALIHEIGNALTAATIAHKMIRDGRVGNAGNTSKVLGSCLHHMWHLISNAQMEIRMGENTGFERTQMNLADITNEINPLIMLEAKSNEVQVHYDVNPSIQLIADRKLVISALSNLINNAIKFTKKGGNIRVRAMETGDRILIEVEDECGGLPDEKIEELFKPFVQKNSNKTGMGLGLSISRRAIELNRGSITARNIPNKGCIFTINLPKE